MGKKLGMLSFQQLSINADLLGTNFVKVFSKIFTELYSRYMLFIVCISNVMEDRSRRPKNIAIGQRRIFFATLHACQSSGQFKVGIILVYYRKKLFLALNHRQHQYSTIMHHRN